MATLQEIIVRLRKAVDERERELESIKKLLKELEATAESLSASTLEIFESALTQGGGIERSINAVEKKRVRGVLPPRDVAHAIRDVILAQNRPMRRGEIVKELEKRGTPLSGRDKTKNIGTIIWRHPEIFVSLKELGYWVKDTPLPGVYPPEG